jgi:hypothetical protein
MVLNHSRFLNQYAYPLHGGSTSRKSRGRRLQSQCFTPVLVGNLGVQFGRAVKPFQVISFCSIFPIFETI